MPTASLPDLMDEMAEQIRNAYATVTDLDVQIEPRMIGRPTGPTIDIFPGDAGRDPASAGMGDLAGGYFITARARTSTADDVAQQDVLLAFLDDQDDLCLAQAVLDDPTLNGNASSTDLQSVTGFLSYPDTGLIGVQWTFLVIPGES